VLRDRTEARNRLSVGVVASASGVAAAAPNVPSPLPGSIETVSETSADAAVFNAVNADRFAVAMFANNLLNSHPQLNLNHQDSNTLLFEAETLRPRTVGVTATYRY